MEIGSKNRRWHEIMLDLRGIVLWQPGKHLQKYHGTLVQFFRIDSKYREFKKNRGFKKAGVKLQ